MKWKTYRQFATFEFDHVAAHFIQEASVVTYYQQSVLVSDKITLEPNHTWNIQVVRRFVLKLKIKQVSRVKDNILRLKTPSEKQIEVRTSIKISGSTNKAAIAMEDIRTSR